MCPREEPQIRRDIELVRRQIDDFYRATFALDEERDRLRAGVSSTWDGSREREALMSSLDALQAEQDALFEGYESLMDQLDALYGELDDVCPKRQERNRRAANDHELNELVAVQQRLGEIMDAQNAAVRAWNSDPRPEHHEEFARRSAELYQEFSILHERSKELHAALAARRPAASAPEVTAADAEGREGGGGDGGGGDGNDERLS